MEQFLYKRPNIKQDLYNAWLLDTESDIWYNTKTDRNEIRS